MSEIDMDFEQALDKLSGIVETLESGGLSLNVSLDKFTEGMKLVKFCNQELNKAEKKIEVVLDQEKNELGPFDEEIE